MSKKPNKKQAGAAVHCAHDRLALVTELRPHPKNPNQHPPEQVFDPFLGSGTTLIAAEGLGRKCYGLEISPAYCAVILQRFKDATGKTPTLLP